MLISIITAMADDRVIGINNSLPWQLPADMQWFRKQTMKKPIIMGRTTYESIGVPLPGRKNIIVTRDQSYQVEGVDITYSIEEAIKAAGDVEEVMIIGGSSVYEQALPLANRLYLTMIHGRFEGDSWFPEFDMAQWREIERSDHAPDEKNAYGYSFLILERS